MSNTIEFIPSYGSIQGSEMTLQSKRGNAFDTASLEIALLRAAGIPARYVYGTIQLPVDKVMNWVGGVTQPEAAQNLLGQGGIPNLALVSGGAISHIRMEHVWVSAYVDYIPSRGAVNKTPDTWAPLDASFKQYQYTQGMDIKTHVPLDATALLTQAQQGATVNAAEGWVQNLNQANIQNALTGYQTQVQSYVSTQNANATVGDVLGSKKIVQRNPAILMGTLPYKTVAVGSRFAALPDNLRHQFKYSLYADEYSRSQDFSIFSYQQSLPNLAGKKVTLSFAPATQADADTIASFLPKPHADGTPIQPSELPSGLPAYLINVTAQLKVEGEIVAQGGIFNLGQELVGEGGFTQNGLDGGWDISPDGTLVAGQASAIGLNLQGMSASQFQALKARMEQTKAKLQASDLTGLNGDLVTGDLLTASVWSYFAAVDTLGQFSQSQAKTIDLPSLSYGLFHVVVAPMKTFGIVMSVTFPGMMMDIGHLRHLRVAKDNDAQTWINYNRLRGQQQSHMEAAVPKQAFTVENAATKPESVSAATAIALATSQGQKIFTLTQANAAAALPQIQQSTSVMAEIQNALNAGKEVTVSEKPVTVAGWTGAGYIIIDPATGAGAYLIEGGANGDMTTTPSPGESLALWMMTQTAAIFTKLASLANSSGVLSILGFIDSAFALTQCSDPIAAELGLYVLTSLTMLGMLLSAMVVVSGGVIAAIGVGIAYSFFTFGVMQDMRKACKK